MTNTRLNDMLRRQKRHLLADLFQAALVAAAVVPGVAGLI